MSGRCADAAFYSTRLVKAIIKGVRETKYLKGKFDDDDRIHAVLESDCTATSAKVKKLGGRHVQLEWGNRNFRPVYKDEYTNDVLLTRLIRAAISEELDY